MIQNFLYVVKIKQIKNILMDSTVQEFLKKIHDPQYIEAQITSLSSAHIQDLYSQFMGLTTLSNLGNTCYLNAILQCLRHTMCLNTHLFTTQTSHRLFTNYHSVPKLGSSCLLLVNYIKIVQIMWENNSACLSPRGFKILLGETIDQFKNTQQHDAHELLVAILQSFHDALSKNVKYRITGEVVSEIDSQIQKAHTDWISYYQNKHSIILDIFSGQCRTQITCLTCQKQSFRFDPTMVQDVSFIPNSTLSQCLDHLITPEQLSEDNLYSCEQCHNRTRAWTARAFWTLPQVLILKFNRFHHQMVGKVSQSFKIEGHVQYPLSDLDLARYVASPLVTETKYDLYAVVCHSGTMSIGHYYSIVYHPNQKVWLCYNDGKLSTVEDPSQLDFNGDAYILFYRRKCSSKSNLIPE